MSKLLRTNKTRPCPVCDKTNGNCRIGDDKILCMTFPDGDGDNPDYRWVKPTQGDYPGGIHVERTDNDFDREAWLQKKAERETRERELEQQRLEKCLTSAQRDREIRSILNQLSLSHVHRQYLEKRNVPAKIVNNCRSVTKGDYGHGLAQPVHVNLPGAWKDGKGLSVAYSGILVAIANHLGQFIGLRLHDPTKTQDAKYCWLTSSSRGIKPNLPNGELPSATHYPDQLTKPEAIGLCEGMEWKSATAANRLGFPVMGFSGHGGISNTPQQIQALLDHTGATEIIIIPDDNCLTNKGVSKSLTSAINYWEGKGYTVKIAWWGQLSKGIGDIDEISPDLVVKFIAPNEFKKQKNTADWLKYQSLSLDELETECHGQTITKTVINQPYFNGVEMFKEGKGKGIVGGMGLGKTTAMVEQAQSLPGLITIGYRNNLGRQTTYKINNHPGQAVQKMMADFSYQDIMENVFLFLCPDSLPKFVEMLELSKPHHRQSFIEYISSQYIFIDELMSVIDHLFYSKTLSGKRIEVLDIFRTALKHCKGLAYADANLADWAVRLLAYWSGKDQEITINTYNNISANLTFLDGAIDGEKLKKHDNYAFLLDMREAIDNNKPIAVCSDSQIFLESVQEYLSTFCKGFQSERVDGKTSSEPHIQKLVENPDKWAGDNPVYALMYNTSAESGIDVSIKNHFVGHWGFYFGIIPCRSFCQIMGRLRDQNCPKYVWARTFSIACNDDQISFSAEALMHYERQALMLESNLLMDDVELSSRLQLIHQNSFPVESKAAFQAMAMRNYEKTNLRECIFHYLERSGYQITRARITRTDSIRAAKTGFKDAKNTVKTQNVTDIATASTKYVGMPTVRLSMDANYADQCAITKAQWIDRLPGLFDPDNMDKDLLGIIVNDAPRLIQGMEKLTLASNPEWLTAIGKSRLNKSLERNAAIPWMKSTQYLECKLLAAIDIQTLVNTLLSQTQLSANDEIVTAIHEKIKGTISIDGQKARGSHYLRRSIPKDPVKLASLLLSKVGIPHNVKDGRLRLNSKLMAKIRPYKDAIELSIKTRFVAMVERILSKPVPEKTVTVRAVTPQTPQAHTEQASQPFSENIFCYKDPMQKKPPFVLPNSKQEITTGSIIFDEVCQTERVVIAINGQTVVSKPIGGGETALTHIDWVRLAG